MNIETEVPAVNKTQELLDTVALFCKVRDILVIPEGLDNVTHVRMSRDYWHYIKTVRECIDKIMSEIPGTGTDTVDELIAKVKALPNYEELK